MSRRSILLFACAMMIVAGAPFAQNAVDLGDSAGGASVAPPSARDEARSALAADRDAFIEALIAKWSAEYDVTNFDELRKELQGKPDWRLVEASLARSSREITIALLGSPAMVRAWFYEGQATATDGLSFGPEARTLEPRVIGLLLSDMSFNTMTPCRNFDTRVSQGGTGPFSAGETRGYLAHEGEAGTNEGEQGGGCRIPDDAYAVAVNLTVVNPSAVGFLTAWSRGTRPDTASMVYQGNTSLLSNSTIVPICFPLVPCNGNDYLVYSNAASEVIGDFVGYFSIVEACPDIIPQRADAIYDLASNRCWDNADKGPSTFFQANDACNSAGGLLPSYSMARSFTGDLSNARDYWLDGFYREGGEFRGQAITGSAALRLRTTTDDLYYRCTYAPYVY